MSDNGGFPSVSLLPGSLATSQLHQRSSKLGFFLNTTCHSNPCIPPPPMILWTPSRCRSSFCRLLESVKRSEKSAPSDPIVVLFRACATRNLYNRWKTSLKLFSACSELLQTYCYNCTASQSWTLCSDSKKMTSLTCPCVQLRPDIVSIPVDSYAEFHWLGDGGHCTNRKCCFIFLKLDFVSDLCIRWAHFHFR